MCVRLTCTLLLSAMHTYHIATFWPDKYVKLLLLLLHVWKCCAMRSFHRLVHFIGSLPNILIQFIRLQWKLHHLVPTSLFPFRRQQRGCRKESQHVRSFDLEDISLCGHVHIVHYYAFHWPWHWAPSTEHWHWRAHKCLCRSISVHVRMNAVYAGIFRLQTLHKNRYFFFIFH